MNKFPCGVKHNFNTGIIVQSDDRKNYEWNCSTCELKETILIKEDLENYKTARRVVCPLLTYE
jgi:hypothetical protein